MVDRRYNSAVLVGSGLASKESYQWQHGLRRVARATGGFFDPSWSGYDGIEDAFDTILASGRKRVVSIGHSNRNFFSTALAQMLKPHGVEVAVCCFDRTMKWCAPVGSNVPAVLDMWAGPPMQKIEIGPDFKGEHTLVEFLEESHISIISNKRAQDMAINFALKWKEQ